MRTNEPWLLNAVPSRLDKVPPEGLDGGEPGAVGDFLVNGKPVSEARKMTMQPGDVVVLGDARRRRLRRSRERDGRTNRISRSRAHMDINTIDWNAKLPGSACAKASSERHFPAKAQPWRSTGCMPGHEPRPASVIPTSRLSYVLSR
jgi:hypothetical protein